MIPIFLKPPLGMQESQCDFPFPCEQPVQDVQCPEQTCAGFFPAVSSISFCGYEVATRRMIFDRSRKSILRKMSSVVVCNSPASISIVRERPSVNKFNSSSMKTSSVRDCRGAKRAGVVELVETTPE